jgi:hypothetical protein
MIRELGVSRSVVVYALVIPLAIFIGYLLTNPLSTSTFAIIGLIVSVLLFPMMLKSHHLWLIATWNASLLVFFLPGQPNLGVAMAVLSLFISVLQRTVNRKAVFLRVPSVGGSLIFITLVVLLTSALTGGIGSQALGAETWGAKRHVGIFGAVIGYFALTAKAIPSERSTLYVALFFLSGLTAAFSDLLYLIGPSTYFMFALFPTDLAYLQAQTTLTRYTGFAWAALAAQSFMLARYGVSGLFDVRRFWRPVLFLALFAATLFGGYRSSLILMVLIILIEFFFEGLIRTRLFVVLLMAGVLLGSVFVAYVDRMPLSVQRSVSFLPLEVDHVAKADAEGTMEWRLQMWKAVIPEIPKYFLLGKGFGFSGTDLYLTQEAMRKGLYTAYEDTLISGNYHSGILTLLIPFGIFGLIGFIWFCAASLRVLYRNFNHGDKALKTVNTFLLSQFAARLIFYVVAYGQFELDLPFFAGIVALSIALNGGVKGDPAPAPVSTADLAPQTA